MIVLCPHDAGFSVFKIRGEGISPQLHRTALSIEFSGGMGNEELPRLEIHK